MEDAKPDLAKLLDASPILKSDTSTVVTRPPLARAALASQSVEYPFDVPSSSTRRAPVARTSTDKNSPVSRVILSIIRERSVVLRSCHSENCSSSSNCTLRGSRTDHKWDKFHPDHVGLPPVT